MYTVACPVQEYYTLIRQCQQVRLAALQKGDEALQQHCQKCVQQWQALIDTSIDTQTASILQVWAKVIDPTNSADVYSKTRRFIHQCLCWT